MGFLLAYCRSVRCHRTHVAPVAQPGDDVPAALLDSWLPTEDGPREWQAPDYDAWIDGLAVDDPDLRPSAAEIVAAGETGTVDARLIGALAAVDIDGLDDTTLVGYMRALTRAPPHRRAAPVGDRALRRTGTRRTARPRRVRLAGSRCRVAAR